MYIYLHYFVHSTSVFYVVTSMQKGKFDVVFIFCSFIYNFFLCDQMACFFFKWSHVNNVMFLPVNWMHVNISYQCYSKHEVTLSCYN